MRKRPTSALVIGLGASGLAAARLLADSGSAVTVTDRRTEAELAGVLEALPPGIRTALGGHPAGLLDSTGLVVTSPGVPSDAPILLEARRRGIAVVTEIELAWRHRPDALLVAVTGSNGKSTVTSMTAAILAASGIDTAAGGNLGPPASELVLSGGWDAWVLEVSSFQAEALTAMRPAVAVLLNLSQDHLERHPDMEAYAAAKYRLLAFQDPGDTAVLNRDDPLSAAAPTAARKRFFSLLNDADGALRDDELVVDGEPLMPASGLGVAGRHNAANALAATLAALAAGADRDAAREALARFEGLPHRHRVVVESGGVRWVDDSKATNVGATLAGLEGYPPRSVHLILGGLAKGQDFTVLAPAVRRAAARVYLIGRDAETIAAALGDAAPIERCGTLPEAVRRARAAARAGETVLLAPACASFDQFEDYAARGDAFRELAAGEEVVPCR